MSPTSGAVLGPTVPIRTSEEGKSGTAVGLGLGLGLVGLGLVGLGGRVGLSGLAEGLDGLLAGLDPLSISLDGGPLGLGGAGPALAKGSPSLGSKHHLVTIGFSPTLVPLNPKEQTSRGTSLQTGCGTR